MEKFTVPQFIENEDKILWFLSVRQFLIILAGFGLMFILYKVVDTVYFILGSIIIAGIAGTVAFLKINGQPFHFFVLNIAKSGTRPRLRIWKKEPTKKEWEALEKAQADRLEMEATERRNRLPHEKDSASAQRLSELSLIVDTGGAYHGENQRDIKSS
ncbi:MAG: PrgI family protein [bacterium]|nr:PrgI family protein [bacterium]